MCYKKVELEFFSSKPIALSKSENTFPTILALAFRLMSPKTEKYPKWLN